MPVFRGKDGKIIEERTVPVDDIPTGPFPLNDGPTPQPIARTSSFGADYEAKTVPLSDLQSDIKGGKLGGIQADSEERTRIVGGLRGRSEREDGSRQDLNKDPMQDPVVGWLVVIAGPGQGRVLSLGYGTNSIGRSESERVQLDFGDDQISRSNHAVITYDMRGRRFYVQHGGGKNLTYLGDLPVLAPTELPSFAHISIGGTTLRFVPLCGSDFEWQDLK